MTAFRQDGSGQLSGASKHCCVRLHSLTTSWASWTTAADGRITSEASSWHSLLQPVIAGAVHLGTGQREQENKSSPAAHSRSMAAAQQHERELHADGASDG